MEFLLAFKYLTIYSLLIAVTLSLLLWRRPPAFLSIFIITSLLIPFSVWTYTSVDSIMGYAYAAEPPDKSLVVSYVIKDKMIQLLVIQPNGYIRLYKVKATEKLVKRLKELNKRISKDRGGNIIFERKKRLPYTHPDNWTVKKPGERLPPKNETRNQ